MTLYKIIASTPEGRKALRRARCDGDAREAIMDELGEEKHYGPQTIDLLIDHLCDANETLHEAYNLLYAARSEFRHDHVLMRPLTRFLEENAVG